MQKTIEEKILEYLKDIDSMGYEKTILLNTFQVSKVLGISSGSVEKMRKDGIGINYKKFGKRVMYAKRDIAEFLARSNIETA